MENEFWRSPIVDMHSQTSLSTSPRGNPQSHFEVRLTSSSGWGKFIWTIPQALNFDRGSNSTQTSARSIDHNATRHSRFAFNLLTSVWHWSYFDKL